MAKKGSNNKLAETAGPFLQRVESLEADRESEKGAYMARCRVIGDDIKNVYQEAKGAGVTVKALKGLVKQRRLERKIAAIAVDFDIDEAAQFDELAAAFGDLPFGQHARARADELRQDDEKDLRGNGQRQREADRQDEAQLEQLGRGETVDTLAQQTPHG